MNRRRGKLLVCLCAAVISLGTVLSSLNAAQAGGASGGPESSLVGVWEVQTPKGAFTLLLNANGSGEFNGEEIHWTFNQNVLSVTEPTGTIMYNASLASNSLTLSGANLQAPITFKRLGSPANASPSDDAKNPEASASSQPSGGLGAINDGAASSAPEGTWQVQSAKGTFKMVLNSDGSGRFNNDMIHWEYNQGVLTLKWENGDSFMYNAKLTENSFAVSGGNLHQSINFQRVGSSRSAGGLGIASGDSAPATSPSSSGPVGKWEMQGKNGPVGMALNPDGSGTMAGESVNWVFNQGVLTIARESGDTHMYNAKLTPNSITLSAAGLKQPSVFHRVGATSSPERAGNRTSARLGANAAGPVGSWDVEGPQGTIHMILNPDGSGNFGGGIIHWTYNQTVLSVTGPNGNTQMYNSSLAPNTMTLSGAGLTAPLTFHRAGSGAQAESEESETGAARSQDGLVGRWQGANGVLQLNADHSAEYNGTRLKYTVQGDTLTLIGADGEFPVPYSLKGNTLTVTIQGQTGNLTRTASGGSSRTQAGGSHPPALAGQWCYFAGTNSGQIVGEHQQCFTLNSNGTYTYFNNFDSVNQYGGANSSGSDQGTWSVNGSTLTANSQKSGVLNYQLELRNNKNNDPMICIDGQCFATTTQKPPWP